MLKSRLQSLRKPEEPESLLESPTTSQTTIEPEPDTPMPSGAAAEVAERVIEDSAPRKRGRRPMTDEEKEQRRLEREAAKGITVTPSEVKMCGAMFATAFGFVAPWIKAAPLNDEQEGRAGEAFAPVLAKYAPIAGKYALEINAGMVLITLVRESRKAYVPPKSEEETAREEWETRRESSMAMNRVAGNGPGGW